MLFTYKNVSFILISYVWLWNFLKRDSKLSQLFDILKLLTSDFVCDTLKYSSTYYGLSMKNIS